MSVTSIAAAKPESSQGISQNFIETDLAFPDDNTRGRIEVSWVPGHTEREGNDRVDEMAKGTTELELVTAVARHYRRLRKTMRGEWVME